MLIKQIYIIILGILLTLFVSVGITTFYPEPQPPLSAPISFPVVAPSSQSEQKIQTKNISDQNLWQKKYSEYQNNDKKYNRNVSIIAIFISVVFLILSLTIFKQLNILADGFLLGSLFTLLTSIFNGFKSDDSKYRFVVITVVLLITLVLGYLKFIRINQLTTKK